MPASLHVVRQLDVEKVATLVPLGGREIIVDNQSIVGKASLSNLEVVGKLAGILNLEFLAAAPVDAEDTGVPGRIGAVTLGMAVAPMAEPDGLAGTSGGHVEAVGVDGLALTGGTGLPVIKLPEIILALLNPVAVPVLGPRIALALDIPANHQHNSRRNKQRKPTWE